MVENMNVRPSSSLNLTCVYTDERNRIADTQKLNMTCSRVYSNVTKGRQMGNSLKMWQI